MFFEAISQNGNFLTSRPEQRLVTLATLRSLVPAARRNCNTKRTKRLVRFLLSAAVIRAWLALIIDQSLNC